VPNVSNVDILESAYKMQDALVPYIRLMVALLDEQGVSEKDRNIQMYKLAEKLGEASKDVQPQGVVTLTLAYTLNKFLEQVIKSTTP
jgi:hypothetical protein